MTSYEPPLETLYKVFIVNFDTGQLFWKVQSAKRIKIGDLAGISQAYVEAHKRIHGEFSPFTH